MKALLIVFAILLLLLTLLSTFGGSIRQNEPFFAPSSREYYYETPKMPSMVYDAMNNIQLPGVTGMTKMPGMGEVPGMSQVPGMPQHENYGDLSPAAYPISEHYAEEGDDYVEDDSDDMTPEPFENKDVPPFASY